MKSSSAQPGLEAWVENSKDKTHLNEYQIIHHPANGKKGAYTECFLETIDEPFTIHISRQADVSPTHDWRVNCFVDGQRLGNSMWPRGKGLLKAFKKMTERKDGKWYESKLSFAPLPITGEDEEVTLDITALKDFGRIKIKLCRGQWSPSHSHWKRTTTTIQSGIAHEKVKKLPYSIVATDSKPVDVGPTTMFKFVDHSPGEVFYTFIFNYRPRVVLSIMNLVDDTAAVPGPQNDDRSSSKTITADDKKSSVPKVESCKQLSIKRSSSRTVDVDDGKASKQKKRVKRD